MAIKLSAGAIVVSISLSLAFFVGHGQPVLADGGSGKKHDDVADTVKKEVAKAMKKNRRIGAALVRLLFHDCWVHGCDGSVLLDKTPDGGSTEKDAANNIGLEGFDLIDMIKGKLGESVSCADIVVLAARDATYILSRGNIAYHVTTGRKDGVRSSAAAADAVLPPSTFNFTQLKANFAARNFTQTELVVLSGAHAVGVAHLSSFRDRLDNATATPISVRYQNALRDHVEDKTTATVPDPTEMNNIRDMELAFRNASGYNATGVDTSKAARGVLDNSYYHANLQNKVLFRSDWELRNDTTGAAGRDMREFRDNAARWYVLFGNAMAKLSEVPAEGTRFEIRKDCRTTN
ncbi:peroxidase 5-like [Hordeum vulgare subsp. vulgare]|uniref:Peroxidase n=1 Tax=Hordeum vulgare subsp. vulgare TaxID=112509 RepID=A0A8I6WEZ3_HORVV|nr:peroxidase 5-like [Hordeum vulgare subsp. vulgare]